MSIQKLNSTILKKQALQELTNIFEQQNSDANREYRKRSVNVYIQKL